MTLLENRLRSIELQLCDTIRAMNMCAHALVTPPVTEIEAAGVASVLTGQVEKLGVLREAIKNVRTEGG